MSNAKEQVVEVLKRLPDDCTLEDVQYALYVVQKVQRALDDVDRRGGISNEDAMRHLRRWLRA